jgi:hypothetical protein
MITLKCTRKLLKLLDVVPTEEPPLPTSALGDWYANVIPTAAGELVVFANERTLLSVALPIEMMDTLVSAFAARVYNLLVLIDVAEEIALREIAGLKQVEFAKTTNRSVLGSLNEISLHYQLIAERDAAGGALRLSEVELQLSRTLHKPLDYVYPAEVARRLLAEHYNTRVEAKKTA